MKAAQYAEAIFLAARSKDDAGCDHVVARTVALLKERGHLSLLPAVVRELEKLQKIRQTGDVCVLRVANVADAERHRQEIKEDVCTLGATALPQQTQVDRTAIGGYVVLARGKRIDRTYKRSLIDLYRTLVTNPVTN